MVKKCFKSSLSIILLFFVVMFSSVRVYATQSKTENFNKSYNLGSDQAENLVNVALKQIGKSEANLGYTEAWCADFVCDCAKLTGMSDSIIPYNYGARGGCIYLYNYMVKNCSAKQVSSREKGDIIFYYCSACGRYVHTGIVLDGTYTIEGNYGGKVTQVKNSYRDKAGHTLASGTITRKYLRPKYENSPKPITTSPSIWKNTDRYTVGDSVKFTWNSVENATGYWFSVWYKGEQIVTTQVSENSEYTLWNLGAGEYTAFINAYNDVNNMESSISLTVDYPTGEDTISSGKYRICTALDNTSVVSVSYASTSDEANVILHANEYHTNQIFDFQYLGDGYYKITAEHSGKCLDVYNAENKSGANVQQYSWNNHDNQKWIVKEAGNGYFYIISKANGLYLDVYGGQAQNYANIDTYSGHEGASEKWRLIPYIEGKKEIENGTYTIQSALDRTYGLNVAGKSKDSEANIELGREQDIYRITYLEDGTYQIINTNSGKSLDAYGIDEMQGKKRGTNVQQYSWHNADNQKWIISSAGNGQYYVICKENGLYLDVYGGQAGQGTNIDLWSRNEKLCQKWYFVPVKKEISECNLKLSKENYIYDGKEKNPDITIKEGNIVLTKDTDYTATYTNNINAGAATVEITGTGKYTGTVTKQFTINKAEQQFSVSLDKTNILIGETAQIKVTGQGKISYQSAEEDVVTVDNTGLIIGKKAGKATITVIASGTENYNSAEKNVVVNVQQKCVGNQHTWDDGRVTTKVSCTVDGVKTYTCTLCGATKIEVIQSTGHQKTELKNVKEATCLQEGYTGDTYCQTCGKKLLSGSIVEKKAHVWDEGEVTQAATCTVNGTKTYTCNNCKTTRVEEIVATGHKNIEYRNYKEATCAEEGYTGDLYCRDCDTELSKGKTIAKKSHIWNSGEITAEATCTENGVKTYTCTVCKTTRVEELPATDHRHVELQNEVEATCLQEGYTGDIYCMDCKTIISVGESFPKIDHSWDEGKITTPAACTTAGVKTYTCTFCGATKTEELPATGHVTKVTKFAKAATCKTEGYSGDVYCQDCGILLEEGKVLPKAEHSWNEGEITTAATCTMEGTRTFTCTVCEETKSEKIPAVGHGATEVRNRKDATCAAEGYTGDTHCTVCGEVISKGEITAMTAHSWDAGKITKQPTTTKTGTKTFTCQTCGLTRTETVAKLKVKKLTPGKIVKSKVTNGVYKVLKDGRSVEFTKPIAKRASVKIANTIKINGITCKVTGISASAFKNNTFLRTVIIGKNVTSIGSNAFYGCKKLTRITGGSAVTKIGDKAFYNCSSLMSITIPAGVNKIGKMAFYNCKKLRTIVVKTSKLTSRNIGSKAFAGTYAKAAIKVPVKQLNTYKKLFKSKGMGPKAVYKK